MGNYNNEMTHSEAVEVGVIKQKAREKATKSREGGKELWAKYRELRKIRESALNAKRGASKKYTETTAKLEWLENEIAYESRKKPDPDPFKEDARQKRI